MFAGWSPSLKLIAAGAEESIAPAGSRVQSTDRALEPCYGRALGFDCPAVFTNIARFQTLDARFSRIDEVLKPLSPIGGHSWNLI